MRSQKLEKGSETTKVIAPGSLESHSWRPILNQEIQPMFSKVIFYLINHLIFKTFINSYAISSCYSPNKII